MEECDTKGLCKRIRLISILSTFLLLVLVLTPEAVFAEKDFSMNVNASVGFFTLGFDINLFYTIDSGVSFGIFNTAVFPLMEEVAGMKVNLDIYDTMLFLGGYRINLIRKVLFLSVYGALGCEIAVINEAINNLNYAIDRSYSVTDVLFEGGFLTSLDWRFLKTIGINVSLYTSLAELKKSLFSVGLSFGWPPF